MVELRATLNTRYEHWASIHKPQSPKVAVSGAPSRSTTLSLRDSVQPGIMSMSSTSSESVSTSASTSESLGKKKKESAVQRLKNAFSLGKKRHSAEESGVKGATEDAAMSSPQSSADGSSLSRNMSTKSRKSELKSIAYATPRYVYHLVTWRALLDYHAHHDYLPSTANKIHFGIDTTRLCLVRRQI